MTYPQRAVHGWVVEAGLRLRLRLRLGGSLSIRSEGSQGQSRARGTLQSARLAAVRHVSTVAAEGRRSACV